MPALPPIAFSVIHRVIHSQLRITLGETRWRKTKTKRSSNWTVGDDVTYVVNRNINFTNVCYTGCRFCAFAQRRRRRRLHAVARRGGRPRRGGVGAGATEVCMQGGIHPDLPGTAYPDLAREVKRRARRSTCTRSRRWRS